MSRRVAFCWHYVHPVTLWLGVYAITCSLFYFELHDIRRSMVMGLISATLKTLWALWHKHLTHRATHIEEDLRA